jgi:hypothetical protein
MSQTQLAREFRSLSSDDLTTSEADVQATKEMDGPNTSSRTSDGRQAVLCGSSLGPLHFDWKR